MMETDPSPATDQRSEALNASTPDPGSLPEPGEAAPGPPGSAVTGARPLDGLRLPDGVDVAIYAARHADAKQAVDIKVLDVTGLTSVADYFVICSGSSMPHLKAIRNEVLTQLRDEHGLRSRAADGNVESHWLVIDYGDVMVHVFHEEKRPFYALEDLWSDARTIEWRESGGPPTRA